MSPEHYIIDLLSEDEPFLLRWGRGGFGSEVERFRYAICEMVASGQVVMIELAQEKPIALWQVRALLAGDCAEETLDPYGLIQGPGWVKA